MRQGFPSLGFLHPAEKSLVFCRHFNVESKQTNVLASKLTLLKLEIKEINII
jgi:hypothetical protein